MVFQYFCIPVLRITEATWPIQFFVYIAELKKFYRRTYCERKLFLSIKLLSQKYLPMAVIISAFNKWKFFYAANYECYVFLCVCLFKVLLESSECFQPGKNTIKFIVS